MANPFYVEPVSLQGLGQIAQAYGQKQQKEEQQALQQQEKEQQLQQRQSAFKLLGESQQTEDPAQRKQLFMQAYQQDPEMVKGYIDTIKQQKAGEQIGVEKPGEAKVGAQEILEDGTVIQSTPAGTKVYNPQGVLVTGKGAAEAVKMARAVKIANQRKASGEKKLATLEAQNELEGEVAAGVISKKEAAKASIQAFDKISAIEEKIGLYDEGIRLIDEGAGSGRIEKMFPSFKTASIKLDNLANRLGLDVVGNTTFGALSAGELAMAMSTALPTGLDGPELREWMVEKKGVQEKLADYLESAAIYLGTPGNTKVGWLKKKRLERSQGQQPAQAQAEQAPQAAIDFLRANPQAADQFKAKFGYLPEGL